MPTFEADRAIARAPAIHPAGSLAHVIGTLDPSGRLWAWEPAPATDGATVVTHTCDGSGVTDQEALSLHPRVSPEQMPGSIGRIADALG